MDYPQTPLGQDDVLNLLNQTTGFLTQEGEGLRYVVREAGLVVTIYPGGRDPSTVPCPHWPAHIGALIGERPTGGVRSLVGLTELLRRYGSLPVSRIVHFGEGTGPDGRDFTIGEILPGQPFDETANRMGSRAARQLGEHLGRLHTATARIDGFGAFDEAPIRWNRWWNRFALSYGVLADGVCDASPALHGFRRRMDVVLDRATRSPTPRAYPLVGIDPSPSHYLSDAHGTISGFVNVDGHLWAPAEWELSAILLWMPHPHAFREGYERYRRWPEWMDEVREAYATYALLERRLRACDQVGHPGEVANLEARIIGTLV